MAVLLRKTGELEYIAFCAAENEKEKDDIYLDDAQSHALSEKYYEDFVEMGFIKENIGGCKI